VRRPVGTPDSVQVLAVLANGARATYHFSGVTPFGQQMAITLYGTEGVLRYDLMNDQILGASKTRGKTTDLQEVPIPPDKAGGWRVEAEFIEAIRESKPIRFTDFATGLQYMEFTQAVALSAERNSAVEIAG
jgi:predicted dehydrogenase